MKSVNKKYLRSFLILAVFFALFGVISQVSAIAPYIPLVKLPGIDQAEANNLPAYLKAMFKLLIGVAGALAVVMITLGGIEYMSTDSMFGKEEGRKKINNALLGLLLAIGACLILFTVNPKLLDFNFNPAPVAPTGSPPRIAETGVWHKRVRCSNASTTPQTIIEDKGEYGYEIGNSQDSQRALDECNNSDPRSGGPFRGNQECQLGWSSGCSQR